MHAVGVDAEPNIAVEDGLEVSAQAVQNARVRYVERELGGPRVVTVGRRQAWCE